MYFPKVSIRPYPSPSEFTYQQTQLLTLASTASLTTGATTNAYPLAAVSLKAHNDCAHGLTPDDAGAWISGTLATPDACTQIEVEKAWEISHFSVDAWMITPETMERCHGAAIFADGDCTGRPFYVLPFEYGRRHVRGVCLPDSLEWVVAVQLICEPEDF
jgi:hypothetical protein